MNLTLAGLFLASVASPTPLSEDTLSAWRKSVSSAEAQLTRPAFLQIDGRPDCLRRVSAGEIESEPGAHGGMVSVPSGLVHHWVGTVFLPGVGTSELLSIMQDYDSYSVTYRPAVVESKLLSHDGNDFDYRVKMVESGFGLKSGFVGDFHAQYHQLNENEGYAVTEGTRLVQLSNDSTPEYVRGVVTIARYRHSNGGMYLEVETLTLSRDIPGAIKWMASPMVKHFAKQAMVETLERLRTRVNQVHLFETARLAGGK
jgi:hypothetical protein